MTFLQLLTQTTLQANAKCISRLKHKTYSLFLVFTADAHRVELHPDERGVRAAHRVRGEDELLSNRASLLRRLPHLGHREPAARLHRCLHSS